MRQAKLAENSRSHFLELFHHPFDSGLLTSYEIINVRLKIGVR